MSVQFENMHRKFNGKDRIPLNTYPSANSAAHNYYWTILHDPTRANLLLLTAIYFQFSGFLGFCNTVALTSGKASGLYGMALANLRTFL